MPKIPVVQTLLAEKVSAALEEKLGTEISIGRIDLRLPNRITIDNVLLYDQQHKEMLTAGRLSAGIELLPLIEGKIRITSAQLFGVNATLYQQNSHKPLNCQFLIDSLKNKDTLHHTPLDLAVSSLIIRHGKVKYDCFDTPSKLHHFSPKHLSVSNLSSHIIINELTDDNVDMTVKRLSLNEQSGLDVRELVFHLTADKKRINVSGLSLRLPSSHLTLSLDASKSNDTTDFNASAKGHISTSDITFIFDRLKGTADTYHITATAKGNTEKSRVSLVLSSTGKDAILQASATLCGILDKPHGDISIQRLSASAAFLSHLPAYGIVLPKEILYIGDINAKVNATVASPQDISGSADITSTNAGSLHLAAEYKAPAINAHIQTTGLNLAKVITGGKFGNIACDLKVSTRNIQALRQNTSVKGTISELAYNRYTYRNINLDGTLSGNILRGMLDLNDPNATLHAEGSGDIDRKKILNADIKVSHFMAKHLNLTDILGEEPHHAALHISPEQITLESDIADISLCGTVDPSTLPQSIANIIGSQLPSMPGLPRLSPTHDNFTVSAHIKDLSLLRRLISPSVEFLEDVTLNGHLNAPLNEADITLFAPSVLIGGQKLEETTLHFSTPNGIVNANLTSIFMDKDGPVSLELNTTGQNNKLLSTLSWDNHRENIFRGNIHTEAQFSGTPGMGETLVLTIPHSTFEVGDSLWTVHSRNICYSGGIITVDNLNIGNDTQHIRLNGVISHNATDSLVADLSNLNIDYILNLVNFHSVSFDGRAFGTIVTKSLLDAPEAHATLDVRNFIFEQGHLGTLSLNASYSNDTGKITLSGTARDDKANSHLSLDGYVEPVPGAIELNMHALNTRMEFMEGFCGSFMHDCDMRGSGELQLYGPFSAINLRGAIKATGSFTLTSTNCRYTMPGDSIHFVPDDIQLRSVPLLDQYGNTAVLSGGIHHINLTRMSYDITATAHQFLAYDIPSLPTGETFCGRAFIDGTIGIHGKGNELLLTANARTLPGTYLIYNASSPDAIRSGDIITWRSANGNDTATLMHTDHDGESVIDPILDSGNNRTNIRMNFTLDATPDAKLHIIMDEASGDYVDLFGNGNLRVNYYNKGSLDIFGNYNIEHGTYKMTIQNLLRRDFAFSKGGTITFGGDPYDAVLNLQAAYTINSVPLTDLNIGTGFTAGNVPVKCLMDITGTPGKPSVAFGLDLPSLNTDARQMVNAVINSEEEMNQQVLYLLAIGRFYAPSDATTSSSSSSASSSTERVSQSTLAVQSFLSTTLSQQFNNAMSGVMGKLLGTNNSLSFGANIAPGDEGFSNAEYEGLLSGRFFNNRLLFNGQFGYRDNINSATTSFIGDFTVRYILTRNGNISLLMYNQSNDRYFTRNTLNTQGLGIVFQKEWGK